MAWVSQVFMILTCWTLKSCYFKNWELFHWMSFSRLRSLWWHRHGQITGSWLAPTSRRWISENWQIKIYWTVNCEVETNNKCFVHSRLWFLWKTWNHWGCPDKEIQDKFKFFLFCPTYTNKLLSLVFIFNVQYFIKININVVWQLSLQQKIFIKTKQKLFQLARH